MPPPKIRSFSFSNTKPNTTHTSVNIMNTAYDLIKYIILLHLVWIIALYFRSTFLQIFELLKVFMKFIRPFISDLYILRVATLNDTCKKYNMILISPKRLKLTLVKLMNFTSYLRNWYRSFQKTTNVKLEVWIEKTAVSKHRSGNKCKTKINITAGVEQMLFLTWTEKYKRKQIFCNRNKCYYVFHICSTWYKVVVGLFVCIIRKVSACIL